MTLAYWCVLIAGLLPYAWAGAAKAGGRAGMDNRKPRDYMEGLQGWRQRANWAQLNAFEGLPLFAAAVIIAHLAGGPQARIDLIAALFVTLRVLHGLFYIVDRSTLRSAVWIAGLGCVVSLFVIAA